MSTIANPGGLEDVVAGTSSICFIDGKEGRLLYQGYDIDQLVAHATFEEVLYLLWHGYLPTQEQLTALSEQLAAARLLPAPVLTLLRSLPSSTPPMAVLRTAVSLLGIYDPDAGQNNPAANLRKAIRLTAQVGSLMAAWGRLMAGQEPLPPRPDLHSHAAHLLYALKGQAPAGEEAHALDLCLILHADHELNASTFAARVTAGTLSDLHAAITSAMGALQGPLHGGANSAVMQMLLEIGQAEKADAWVRRALATRKRIMGFGHRVYRTMDPRAVPLRSLSLAMGRRAGETRWHEIAETIFQVVQQEKGLWPNVDFYSAPTYYSMGIPISLFAPLFAVSRIGGWTAHVLEQYANNRLIRPRAEYNGPLRRAWVPIHERR